jgi:hypothetical protein
MYNMATTKNKKNTPPKNQLQKIRQNLLAIRRGATPAEMSERMRELCNANGYDPVYELMDLVRVGEKVKIKDADGNELETHVPLDAKLQVEIHKVMLKYIYPELKAVDITGSIEANITVNVKDFGSNKIPEKMKQAIDADFSMVGEKITENLAKIRSSATGEENG